MAATPIRPARRTWRGRLDFSPPRQRHPLQQPVTEPRGVGREKGRTKTDACRATSVFPPADIASPTTTTDSVAAAVAVVMAQNRFSIFCRRKTTGKEGRKEGKRRKGIVPKTALATSASSSSIARSRRRRGETGRSLCCHRTGREGRKGRFLEASGSNDGKYPILWQTDRTHSHEPSGLLGGFWRESVIATKALEMSHFGELRKGCQIWSVRGAHFPRLPSPHRGRETLFIRQAAGKFVYLGAGSQICSAGGKRIRSV